MEVYGNGASAELILNGVLLGRKDVEDYRAVFETEYQPGVLEAVLYAGDGTEIARNVLTSAQGNVKLELKNEQENPGCAEPVYVELHIQDEKGNIECNRDEKITVNVKGGKLLAFGSADPRTEETFDSGNYTTYYGKAQVIVMKDEPGTITIAAESETLGRAEITVDVI